MKNSSVESKQSQGVVVNEQKADNRSGTIYRAAGNLFIVKDCSKTIPHVFAGSIRGTISGFSPGAGIRMRRYLRECLSEYKVMVTLTYPFSYPTNGKATKEHLRRLLQELKREYYRTVEQHTGTQDHSSFWFLEFQHRGAPHYHIFTTWAPSKDWIARRWYEIVNSEDIRHLQAGTRTEYLRSGRAGTIAYASKYAAKLEQKEVPENFENVGRFWGVHGRKTTMAASTFVNNTADMFNRVYQARKSMFLILNALIWEGRAEIIHRSEGSLVVNLLDKYSQVRMRGTVGRITALTGMYEDTFEDAEIEEDVVLCR